MPVLPTHALQEGGAIGLSEEDMAPARAAFAKYADDLDAAGVLIGTQVLQSAVSSTTFTARDGAPRIQDGPFAARRNGWAGIRHRGARPGCRAVLGEAVPGRRMGVDRNPSRRSHLRQWQGLVQP